MSFSRLFSCIKSPYQSLPRDEKEADENNIANMLPFIPSPDIGLLTLGETWRVFVDAGDKEADAVIVYGMYNHKIICVANDEDTRSQLMEIAKKSYDRYGDHTTSAPVAHSWAQFDPTGEMFEAYTSYRNQPSCSIM
jgi:hypothetical protein